MNFQDIENHRQALHEKAKKLSRKRLKLTLIIFCILLVVEIAAAGASIANYGWDNFFNPKSAFQSTITIVVAIFGPLMEFGVIMLIINVTTSGDISSEEKTYKKLYKAYYIDRQLKATFTDLIYNHDRGLDKSILKEANHIPIGNLYKSNDLVVGKYKGVGFMQADVDIRNEEVHTNSDGETYTTVKRIFSGRYLIFDFPKSFNSNLVIVPSDRYISEAGNLSIIETESVDFHKQFLVYGEDHFEMLYILTPDFMVRMQEIANVFKNRVSFYFSKNRLYIGIDDSNDAFEPPSIARPLNEKTESDRIKNEVLPITQFVDRLKLSK